MKILSFIFAIYFLTLAIIPCGNKECSDNGKKSTVLVQSNSCQDTNHEDEVCSPLCMCHCCGGVTLVCDIINNTIVLNSTELNSLYSPHNISEVSISIWQPPKV